MKMKKKKKKYLSPEFEVYKVHLIPDALNTPSNPDNGNWDWGDDDWGDDWTYPGNRSLDPEF